MTPEERRRLDRYLDRLDRVLRRSEETAPQRRKERRAELRALREKLMPPDKRPTENGPEDDEPKH